MAYAMVIATAGLWIMLDVSAAQFIRLVFSGDRNSMGIAAGLFSGLAYGLLIILLRILAQGFDPFVLVFFQNAIISVILFPFTGMTLPLISDIAVLAILGVVHSTIAPLLYFRGMSRVTAGTAAILGYIEPVCAIILGCLFLFEPVTFKTVIGGSMIIFSGFLIALQRNRTCRAKNINEEERV
jgi:drug/metabolite transporter (DMT)-like permease